MSLRNGVDVTGIFAAGREHDVARVVLLPILCGRGMARAGISRLQSRMMVKILPVLLIIGLMFYAWYRNDLRRITRDYACSWSFDGALEQCIVRFPAGESGTDCLLGADSVGLYMSSSSDALKKSRQWSHRYYALSTPVFIPWSQLRIGDAKFPMRGHLRFQVPSIRATFFVPRETGALLLRRSGRDTWPGGL